MTKDLSSQDRAILLKIARQSIQDHLKRDKLPDILPENFSQDLQEPGASFVTLTLNDMLRGCVGSIKATQALVLDVRDRAVGAAFYDPRFQALTQSELEDVTVEISRLSSPKQIQYSSPEELPGLLKPGIDGVILGYQSRRATFLPQVWEQLAAPEIFLGRLCLKMGLDKLAWKTLIMDVELYQVEKFAESD